MAAKKPKGMSDDELVPLLEEMNRQAIGYQSDEVSIDQDSNLDRYLGKPYGDEEEGRSNAMSMDVAEVVDWALPDLLEPFLSGDRFVEFEPQKETDVEWCDTASDYANHIFFKDNSGVIILHDTVKTACIQKLGVIKTTWREEEKTETQTLTGVSAAHMAELQADPSITIDEASGVPIAQAGIEPDLAQAFEDGQVYTVHITRTSKRGCVKMASVPPEEFKVSSRTSDLETTEYCAHETEQTRGELIDMGFDNDVVMSLKSERKQNEDARADGRFHDENRNEAAARQALNEKVTLIEEYPLIDVNKDGRLERVQIFRVGKTILEKSEVTEHPFDTWTPDRIPHRLIGLALADKVKQTQKIKTHLTRNMLDNVYLANNPRIEVPESATGDNTIDDLLNVRIGGLIRTKGPGQQMRPIEVPDRSKTALDAILYLDSVREQQSGITKNGMSVNSETLDPKSAYQSRKEDRNEQARKRLMCRMLAETLLVPVFRKILRIIVRYQDFERMVRVNRKFVKIDPRGWNADLSATVAVGLGHANREEELQAATLIGQAQQLAQPLGLVTPQNLYKAASLLVRSVGERFPEQYFVDPDSPEGQKAMADHQQAAAQDPKMVEVQGKLQMKQAELQMDMKFKQIETERDFATEQLKAQAKMAIDQQKTEFDYKAKLMQLNAEYDLKQQQMFAELQLRRQEMGMEAAMSAEQMANDNDRADRQQDIDAQHADKRMKNEHKVAVKKASMTPVRMGGKVG
jgi:hypothetical protein